MRVCLVGHFSSTPDEGVRAITYYLSREVSKYHDVLSLDVRYPNVWQVSIFQPHIIHFILSPTSIGLVIAKIFSIACESARTVISAPHPFFLNSKRLMSLLRPDLILVQSSYSQELFSHLGYETCFLPNGVDVEKFLPCSRDTKNMLREKYGLDQKRFVVLHVGPIKRNRNLKLLNKLSLDNDHLILIIGRASRDVDETLYGELHKKGCIVWTKYFDHMEEIYGLSDCYAFPTFDRESCVEIPLSILEAMSCNLPVITTRFGALPDIVNAGDGLFFADGLNNFTEALGNIRNKNMSIRTREKVLPYSWKNITQRLNEIYQSLI